MPCAVLNQPSTLCTPSQVAINGERPWLDPDCPEPLRRLITKCWHQDPHVSWGRVVVGALLGQQLRGLWRWCTVG